MDSAGRLEVKIDRSWTSVKKVSMDASSNESNESVMDKVSNSACK